MDPDPVAYSGSPIISRTFIGFNAAWAVARFTDILLAAGWINVTSITGGLRLAGTSPEGLFAYLDVFVSGSSMIIQFVSQDLAHFGWGNSIGFLGGGTPPTYQVIAGRCQFFISVPGLDANNAGSVCCGGIPYCALATPIGQCAILPPDTPVTEIWWSVSDAVGSFATGTTPRTALGKQDLTACGFINGSLQIHGGGTDAGLDIVFYDAVTDIAGSGDVFAIKWEDGSPLRIAPFIGWGTTNSDVVQLRGSMYDAYIETQPNALDLVVTDSSGLQWTNFTDMFTPGSLFLLSGPFGASGRTKSNYAYFGL